MAKLKFKLIKLGDNDNFPENAQSVIWNTAGNVDNDTRYMFVKTNQNTGQDEIVGEMLGQKIILGGGDGGGDDIKDVLQALDFLNNGYGNDSGGGGGAT